MEPDTLFLLRAKTENGNSGTEILACINSGSLVYNFQGRATQNENSCLDAQGSWGRMPLRNARRLRHWRGMWTTPKLGRRVDTVQPGVCLRIAGREPGNPRWRRTGMKRSIRLFMAWLSWERA